jgi:histone H3/H4
MSTDLVKFQSYVKKVANTRLDQKVNISDKAKNALSEWLNLQGSAFVAATAAQPGSKTIMPQTVGAAAETFFSSGALETIRGGMNQSLQNWNENQTETDGQEEKKRRSKSDLAGLKLPVPKVRTWLKGTSRRVSEESTILATAALEYWLVTVLSEALDHAHQNKRRGINADDVHFAATQAGAALTSPPEHDVQEDGDEDAKPKKKRGRKRKVKTEDNDEAPTEEVAATEDVKPKKKRGRKKKVKPEAAEAATVEA